MRMQMQKVGCFISACMICVLRYVFGVLVYPQENLGGLYSWGLFIDTRDSASAGGATLDAH